MGRNLRLQTQRLCTLCDLNKVEDEFYFLMSCPRYAHQQCYVLNQDFPSVAHLQLTDQFITDCRGFHELQIFVYKLLKLPEPQGRLAL